MKLAGWFCGGDIYRKLFRLQFDISRLCIINEREKATAYNSHDAYKMLCRASKCIHEKLFALHLLVQSDHVLLIYRDMEFLFFILVSLFFSHDYFSCKLIYLFPESLNWK